MTWNAVAMHGLVLEIVSCTFWIRCRKRYVEPLVLHLLLPLNLWSIVQTQPAWQFSLSIISIYIHLNWQYCFDFFIITGGPLNIFLGYMILLLPSLGYKDFYVKNVLSHTTRLRNSLPACDCLMIDLNGLEWELLSFVCMPMPCSGCLALQGVNTNLKKKHQD